jgi:hypothetical protein
MILATYPVGGVPDVKASTEFLTVGATLGYHPLTTGVCTSVTGEA